MTALGAALWARCDRVKSSNEGADRLRRLQHEGKVPNGSREAVSQYLAEYEMFRLTRTRTASAHLMTRRGI